MKKVFLLFTLFLAASALSASAQTAAGADSVKTQVLAATPDSVKADASPAMAVTADTLKPKQPYIAFNYSLVKAVKPVTPVDTTKRRFISTTDAVLQASLAEKIAINMSDLDAQFTAVATDTLNSRIPQKMPANITSLKQQIALVTNDTLRGNYYQKIADGFLRYDSITVRKSRSYFEESALEFTMKALHSYSRATEGYGIMACYNNLSKVYRDQKKFPQAKWFILQANTLARNLFDTPMVVSTLVTLAEIKMDIKDYKLAQRDLDEALVLTTQSHTPKQESVVQSSFVTLYTHLDQPKKAAIALKRHDFIEDSITKAIAAKQLAIVKAQDSTAKAQDSTQQAKKKLFTLAGKKISKTSSAKKTVSL